MSKGLPLPPGFFRCPPLRDAEVQHLRAIADEACADTIANALAMAKLPPKRVVSHPRTKRHAQLHHGPDLRQPELDGITGVTQIATNYDELHSFYHLQTAKQVRTYSKVASQTLLDRVTLYTLERSTSPFRATSIVWAAIETPILKLLPGAIAKRDTCYLECIRDVTVVDGDRVRRGFLRVINSIELACCPSLEASHGLARGQLYRSGHILLESLDQDGLFDFYSTYGGDASGSIPRAIKLKAMEHFVAQMLRVEDHFCQDRMQSRLAMQQRAFVAPAPFRAKAPFCELCFKSFHLLSQKLQCFFCHKMACKRCAHVLHAETMAFPKKIRVCTTCYCPTARRRTTTTVHSDTLSDEASSDYTVGGPITLDDDDKPRAIQLYHPNEMRPSSMTQPTRFDDEWGFTRTTALSVFDSQSSFSSYAPSVVVPSAAGDSTRGQYSYH